MNSGHGRQSTRKPSAGFSRSILLGIGLGLGLGAVFAFGFFFRDLLGSSLLVGSSGVQGNYVLLGEVQGLLDRHFLREQPDLTQRQYGAVRGMLLSLNDPYTYFIDPPVAASESDVLAGTYGGIGVQVQRSTAGEPVLYPFEGSPALDAGIEAGDVLRAINGAPVDMTLSNDTIDQLLRGEVREGSGVELSVTKGDLDEELTVFVPFAVINVPSVVWRLLQEDNRVGYIQVIRFTSRTPDELRTGLQALIDGDAQALVLDLRNNSGGLLQESISVADEFMDTGVVVYERSNDSERAYDAAAGGLAIDLPLMVLINQRTASGAELVAGALQDSDRAVLIGQTSFGKGTVQQIFALSDRSSLHVTSAEWLTPDRQALNQNGLQPDIALEADPNGRDVELEAALGQLQPDLQPESQTT